MIFVTIGCALPFDRLITAMDSWAATHPETGIFAQIGAATLTPAHMPHRRLLSPVQYRARVAQSRVIVAHAGMGSIITACQLGKPIVLLPRRAEAREHTTDHQLATARRFRHVPGIFVADDIAELAPQIAAAAAYGPPPDRLSPYAPTAFTERLRAAILELCP
jgi:UDP-N-acetylglucosamine transferase subunit ALG13